MKGSKHGIETHSLAVKEGIAAVDTEDPTTSPLQGTSADPTKDPDAKMMGYYKDKTGISNRYNLDNPIPCYIPSPKPDQYPSAQNSSDMLGSAGMIILIHPLCL